MAADYSSEYLKSGEMCEEDSRPVCAACKFSHDPGQKTCNEHKNSEFAGNCEQGEYWSDDATCMLCPTGKYNPCECKVHVGG
jgi:hypothetical protein